MTSKKVYVVRFSEDGIGAVCTTMKQAYEAALNYGPLNMTYQQMCNEMRRCHWVQLENNGDRTSVEVERFILNQY